MLGRDGKSTLIYGDLASSSGCVINHVTLGTFKDPGSQCSALSAFLLVVICIRGQIFFPLEVLPFVRIGHLSFPSGLGLMDLVVSLFLASLGCSRQWHERKDSLKKITVISDGTASCQQKAAFIYALQLQGIGPVFLSAAGTGVRKGSLNNGTLE